MSVDLVMEDFGQVGLPRHCWEGLLVDLLPVIDYWVGFRASYSRPDLVDYWGLAGWDCFVVQTLVPT